MYNFNNAKAMVDMMRGSRNPQALLKEYAKNNQNAVAGVVRYPNSWVYDAGKAPFCTCTTTTPTTGA